MATITVDAQALADADAFLTAFLTENVPDADFSKGGVVRDFVITAIAYIFAYLENERKTTRDQQSLLALSTQTDDESVQDAVNALLSNWFITRNSGKVARLVATLHFSTASDVTLNTTTRFFRTADLVFVPDAPQGFVIPAASLIPTFNAANVVIDYTVTVNLVASAIGDQYNVPAGKFVSADQFNPFFTFAENQGDIQGGLPVESTADLLARAPTAISVRNLVNARSIDTQLRDTFPGIARILALGFGDPEMLRDYANEEVTALSMHVGGFTDIYVQLPIVQVVETGVLGSTFARPDNVISILRDGSANFTGGTAVVPGDVLRITSGLTDSPREYIIDPSVTMTAISVAPRAAFNQATDELATFVTYSIGNVAPNFSDKRTSTTGQTSRAVQTAGRITLQGRPHYRIKQVELFNAATPTVIEVLTSRVNNAPNAGEYRVVGPTPPVLQFSGNYQSLGNAQSALAFDQVEVNLTGHTVGTWMCRVTYDTLSGYEDIEAFVTDPFERVLASNPLIKGYTPVYVSMAIAYQVKKDATGVVDEAAASKVIASFINTFDLTKTLDLSGILQNLRDNTPNLGVIINPTVLTYNLFAGDGQVYSYSSKDIVTVYPTYPSNGAHLTNGITLRNPILNADIDPAVTGNTDAFATANFALTGQLQALGVSDRTLIYLSTPADITFTLVS